MNKCIFTGNLTRDPEMRYTNGGKAVTEFSIAVNEGSGDRKTVEYIDFVCWERLAETVAEHCRKGRKVLVEAKLFSESWQDKHQQKRKTIKFRASGVEFLDGPRDPATVSPPGQDQELAGLAF